MGLSISTLWKRLLYSNRCFYKEYKVLMLGLDGAGKTTILYKLKLGEVITTTPTVGFNVERVEYKNIDFTVWDIGGQDKTRQIWNAYYYNTDALIFVIDSNDDHDDDINRLQMAKNELYKLLNQDLLIRNIKGILIFANKQDLPNAMKPCIILQELSSLFLENTNNDDNHYSNLNLKTTTTTTPRWHIQGCCATNGNGLYEGLDWLVDTVQYKHLQKVEEEKIDKN